MNLEKLKAHECRFCANFMWLQVICMQDCKYNNPLLNAELPDLWELHPDLAEETTELKEHTFTTERYHKPVPAFYTTACCGKGPIQDENFCPSCGRRIKK